MKVNESSVLASINPIRLLAAILLICLAAWLCIYLYRNTNDFKKSLKLFIPVTVILDVFFFFALQIDLFLIIGVDLCGFVVLALISNHYFYH